MGESSKENKESNGGEDQKNALEWLVFGVSLLLVLGVLGYWSYHAYTDKPTPPDIYVEMRPSPSELNPFRFNIEVHNKGGQTAENATIEIAIKSNGKEVEKAQLQIPFIPKRSKREGWVNFETDPAKADTLVSRVVSYKKP